MGGLNSVPEEEIYANYEESPTMFETCKLIDNNIQIVYAMTDEVGR